MLHGQWEQMAQYHLFAPLFLIAFIFIGMAAMLPKPAQMALAQRMGLDAAATLDVIEQSSGQSWIGSDRMRRAIRGDLAPRAHMTLLEKDTRLALQAASRESASVEGRSTPQGIGWAARAG